MFGIGRTNYQQRRYEEAYNHYDRLARTYPATKEGREGLNFSAAALLRMGQPRPLLIVTFNTLIVIRTAKESKQLTSMPSTR